MKLHIGDQVVVTTGKDKGKKGKVVRVIPKDLAVVVEGMNMYTKHVKANNGKAGERVRRERALTQGKVAILNGDGKPDRVGYKIKNGKKVRIFKKTGQEVPTVAVEKKG